jgi:hypothetical protein
MGDPIRTGLRRYVSAHICRIRFPWVHDVNPSLQKFRNEVTYKLQPPAPWYVLPVIACVWLALVFLGSMEVLRKYGVHVARRDGIPRHIQLSRMLARAFRHNLSPRSFYISRLGRQRRIAPFTEILPASEMRLFYDRVYRNVDSDLLDRKDRFFEFCNQHGLPTAPIITIAFGDKSPQDAPRLPRKDLFSKPLQTPGLPTESPSRRVS